MSATTTTAAPPTTGPSATTHTDTTSTISTRSLLTAGAVATPMWTGVALAQIATREDFDLARHPISALSNGDFGWIQIANFVVAGALLIAGATGLRRTMADTPGGRWAPRLVAGSGVGMIAAAMLVMDPGNGFPVGASEGSPTTMSWHGIGHLAAGSVTFTALIVASFVLARHFRAAGEPNLTIGARIAGVALLIGNGWAMSGGAAGSLTLAIGSITAMSFVSLTAAWYLRRT